MIIYKATNKINGKSYIGQTTNSLKERIRIHMKPTNDSYFVRALRKYNKENFEWEILEYCGSKEEMDEMEFHYIKQYDTFNDGYNLTLGGDGFVGGTHSEETKKKMSKAHKGKLVGKKHPWYGKKHSFETRQKMSKTRRKKFGDKKNHPMYGKNHTEEAKRNIGISSKNRNSKKWLIIFPDGNEKIIRNLNNFCRNNDLHPVSMLRTAYSKYGRNHHKNFKCKRLYNVEIRRMNNAS